MTYCEQILNQIYQNFMFSVGVYRYDQNLLDLYLTKIKNSDIIVL
jgi:hypothetical protein